MDAVIFAGGKGTRMDDALPKVLVVTKGKPILSYPLDYLLPKVEKIVLAIGHRADEIKAFVTEKYPGKNIVFSIEDEPLGTGGALKQALQQTTSEKVLVLNADDVTDIDPEQVQQNGESTICVTHPRLPFGLVSEKDGYAVFEEKPILDNWVSCGWYVFNREEILPLLPNNGSIEYEVFPKMKLRIYKHEGFWAPLNSKKEVKDFEQRTLPTCHQ